MNEEPAKERLRQIFESTRVSLERQQEVLQILRQHESLAAMSLDCDWVGAEKPLNPLSVLLIQQDFALTTQNLEEIYRMYPQALTGKKHILYMASIKNAHLDAIKFIVQKFPASLKIQYNKRIPLDILLRHCPYTHEKIEFICQAMNMSMSAPLNDCVISAVTSMNHVRGFVRVLPRIKNLLCQMAFYSSTEVEESREVEATRYLINHAKEHSPWTKLHLEFNYRVRLDPMEIPDLTPVLREALQTGANIHGLLFRCSGFLEYFVGLRNDLAASSKFHEVDLTDKHRHHPSGPYVMFHERGCQALNQWIFRGEEGQGTTEYQHYIPKLKFLVSSFSYEFWSKPSFAVTGILVQQVEIYIDGKDCEWKCTSRKKLRTDESGKEQKLEIYRHWIFELAETFLLATGANAQASIAIYTKYGTCPKIWEGRGCSADAHQPNGTFTMEHYFHLLEAVQDVTTLDLEEGFDDDIAFRDRMEELRQEMNFQFLYRALRFDPAFIGGAIQQGN